MTAPYIFKPDIKKITLGENTIAFYEWPKPVNTPKAHVIMVHGLGEHMGRYTHVALALNQAGYAVSGYDHVGHGLSTGVRGDMAASGQLVDDLKRVVMMHKQENASSPLVLLGHSMGGLVVQRAVADNIPGVDAIIMSSPALAAFTNPIQKILLATIPKWFPQLRVDNGLKLNWLARDAQVVRDYKEDKLVHKQISAGLASWIIQQGLLAVAQASEWKMPALLLYAGQDKLVNPQGSTAFIKNASTHYVQSQCFNVMYHEIFNDPEKHLVFQKMIQWLDKRYSESEM